MTRRPRARQRGQAVVLFAIGSVALVGFVGLVLMAGLLYWDQRQLQVDADGGALAGAVKISTSGCPTSTDYTPVQFADQQLAQDLNNQGLSLASALPAQGLWTCGTTVADNFKNIADGSNSSYTATYTYPWNGKPDEINVTITRVNISLPFDLIGSLKGQGNVSLTGRAVAQHNFETPPSTFALYAQNGINCQGAGGPKINVNGSIYSGALISSTGNCLVWAHQTKGFDGTLDYGDILVYADGENWDNSNSGSCVPSTGLAICADGFEVSGHTSVTCGYGAGTPGHAQTEYLNGSTTTNPDPCSGMASAVPLLNEANYSGTEPNADTAITNTIGGPCLANGNPGGGSRSVELKAGNKDYGWGPTPYASGSVEHFVHGCYGYLDLSTFLNNAPNGITSVALDPGFYYFNGYECHFDNQSGCSATSGGGLCLNAGGNNKNMILMGTDISLEFVNSSSFSTADCSPGPTSSCGSSTCDFGTSILPPSTTSVGSAGNSTTWVLPTGTYEFQATYYDSQGETTPAPAGTISLTTSSSHAVSVTAPALPFEATGANFYLVSCSGVAFPAGSCAAGGVNPGLIGSSTASTPTLTFGTAATDATLGNFVNPPSTNSAGLWFAAPPTSPEPPPPVPTLLAGTGSIGNLPAGQYTIVATYQDPEGETTSSSSTSPAATVTLAGLENQVSITTGSASQGVTRVEFYLASDTAGVPTGYIGQVTAPVGTTATFTFSSKTAITTSRTAPTSNSTSSSWCSAYLSDGVTPRPGWTTTDAAICANRLIWAPPAGWSPNGEITGSFYVKGSNENSAILGNIYWPGPANSNPSGNSAGCTYTANGVGGLIGQVICDSLQVQGGSGAGTATIGWTTGAKYGNPPEISLVE